MVDLCVRFDQRVCEEHHLIAGQRAVAVDRGMRGRQRIL
jgi:hypothetical protein